jgi:hypothetical protein
MSFPPGTEMFQFPGFASPTYGFSRRSSLRMGLPHSDIHGSTGCSPLPVAFRSVPRPSSPLSAKASTECPSRHRTAILGSKPSCTGTIRTALTRQEPPRHGTQLRHHNPHPKRLCTMCRRSHPHQVLPLGRPWPVRLRERARRKAASGGAPLARIIPPNGAPTHEPVQFQNRPAAIPRKATPSPPDPFRSSTPKPSSLRRTPSNPRGRRLWRRTGSNRRPPACKAGALPAELRPPPRPADRSARHPGSSPGKLWWAREDLNLRPHAYQACALTS